MNYTPKLQDYRVWFWQYVSLAVSFTNFLCFHNANYYAFISAWWNSCRNSCTAGLLVMNSFSFLWLDIFSISFFISEEQICGVQYSSTEFFYSFYTWIHHPSLSWTTKFVLGSPSKFLWWWLTCGDSFFSCCFQNSLCLWP